MATTDDVFLNSQLANATDQNTQLALQEQLRLLETPSPALIAHGVLSLIGGPAAAYHGYKRNRSWLWALGWFLLGGTIPEITLPVAFAQGFGKTKNPSKSRRRRKRGKRGRK